MFFLKKHWSWVLLPQVPKNSLGSSPPSSIGYLCSFPFPVQFLPWLQLSTWRSYKETPVCLAKLNRGQVSPGADVLEERASAHGDPGLFTGSSVLWGLLMPSPVIT